MHDDIVISIDPDLLPVLPEYLRLVADDLARAEAAIAAGDRPSVRTVGHNIKGSGASFGMRALSEMGAQLEGSAAEASPAGLQEQVAAMRRYTAAIARSLDAASGG
jgi:histidine phosphotransfer protein HptB